MKHVFWIFLFFIPPTFSQECVPECQTTLIITLDYAINRALTANRQVLSSVNALQSSQLKLEVAYSDFDLKMKPMGKGGYSGGGEGGSGLDTGVGLTWDKKASLGTKVNISPYVRRLQDETRIDIDASLTQPLLRGFNREYNLSSLRSAQYSARSALRSLHTSQVTMINRTVAALYEVVKQKKLLEIQNNVYERLLALNHIFKYKEKHDLADSAEISKIESELLQAKDNVEATESKLKDSEDTVRELLVLDLNCCFDIEIPLIFHECTLDCQTGIGMALANRTEIEQSCDDYNDKVRLTGNAKESLRPELNLVLEFNNTGYDRYFRDLGTKHPLTTWTASLTSNSDYARVAERVGYSQSLLALESAQSSHEQAREKVVLEVVHAIRNLEDLATNIHSKEKKIAWQEIERRLAFTKYEKGFGCSCDLLCVEKNLGSSQGALVSAIIDHIVGEYALKAAIGTLMEKPIVTN